MGELAAALNRDGLEHRAPARCRPRGWRSLLQRIADQTISGKIAKEVFEAMWVEGSGADAIIEAQGLRQITDSPPSRRRSMR